VGRAGLVSIGQTRGLCGTGPVVNCRTQNPGGVAGQPPTRFPPDAKEPPPPAWGGGRFCTPFSLLSGFKKSGYAVEKCCEILHGNSRGVVAHSRGGRLGTPPPVFLECGEPPRVMCGGVWAGLVVRGGSGTGFSTGPVMLLRNRGTEKSRLLLNNFNHAIDYCRYRVLIQMTCSVLDNFFISSKYPGWPYIAVLAE